MKTVPLILGLVAAGAIGALAATVMHPTDDGGAAPPAPREDPRVDSLVAAVEQLRQDVAMLRAAPPVAAESPAMRTAGSAEALNGADSPEDAADPAAAAPKGEEFEKAVADAVAKSRQKEMEAIGKMWTDRAAQREKGMVTQFAKDQGLSDYQRDEMIKLMDKRRERLSPLYRAMFTPAPDGETRDFARIREDMQKVRDETQEELKGLISVDQAEAFQKQESSRRGGMGMFGGRRATNSDQR
jgi:hypothetical protein